MIAEALEWSAFAIDLIGVAIMLLGFLLALVRFAPVLLDPAGANAIMRIQLIRCTLGTYLVFALELMIVSDLLHSVVSRTLEDLYFLAGIVVLRTLISYFLGQEIQEVQALQARRAEG